METNFDLIFQIKISDRYQTRYQGLYEYEYEPLDELIATPPFTRCACYYRYTYGCLAGWHCYGILHVSPSQIRLSVVPLKSTFRTFDFDLILLSFFIAFI